MEACRRLLEKERHVPLLKKLVAHRGWHQVGAGTADRPLENTRQAYIDAAQLNVPLAECDVWSTSDGEIVLSHDYCMQSVAEDADDPLARTPISELSWAELRHLKLADGSTPVLLSTVLDDLANTETKLVVELKCSGPAEPLAAALNCCPEMKASIQYVMSFSLGALETFWDAMEKQNVRTLWLLDNPKVPYWYKDKEEGETTFNYANETLNMCLSRLGLKESIRKMRCGLHVQYNPCLTVSHIYAWRSELAVLLNNDDDRAWAAEQTYPIGIWSDAALDPDFDRAASLCELLPAVSFVNTDLPSTFWEGVTA